jgi:transcriptional regulator with XRE-family HTH domain
VDIAGERDAPCASAGARNPANGGHPRADRRHNSHLVTGWHELAPVVEPLVSVGLQDGRVSDFRLGRIARALRHRLGWRQVDVARRADVSQRQVSRVERGQIDNLTVATIARILAALDADLMQIVRWRGGELDRLLDEGHASIVGRLATYLAARSWETQVEVSFSVYGDRGSVDLLAWHRPTATLLVVEVKTEIASVEETIRKHDVKGRLGAGLARERFGWRAAHVARLLVLPGTTTARSRVARHEAVFSRAYPLRGTSLRAWLRKPDGVASGLLFAPDSRRVTGVNSPVGRRRVLVARPRSDRSPLAPLEAPHRPHQSRGG